MTEARKLSETVIKNGYCIGCGACSTVKDSPFSMELNSQGNIIACANEESLDRSKAEVLKICPFSGESKNENEISDIFFPDITNKSDKIGRYIASYVGYVKQNNFREKGSSGGIGKWIGYTLLENNEIDYFIQLKSSQSNESNKLLFTYSIFTDKESVIEGSKSAYYPTTLTEVIEIIKNNEGRYAITGIPCNIKALRLLSLNDEVLKDRIRYTIGIICGGMKSANHSLMVGWQLGVHPKNLIGIDFRRKYLNRPADQKIYQVWSNKDNNERFKDSTKIYGTDYGSGFFKPKPCDFCDDVVSETADVSVGDAWLNEYSKDPKGNSLIIVRNKKLDELLNKYKSDNTIQLDRISEDEAAQAQAGGFRHRREGLSYRISKKENSNEWFPIKRVVSNQFEISTKRKKIYDLREKIAAQSHLSFEKALKNDKIEIFYDEMNPIFNEYKALNEVSNVRIFLRKVKRVLIYDVLKLNRK